MYTINFFRLEEIGNDNQTYIENIEDYELTLSSLDDVKSFLRSDFYEAVYDYLFSYLDGIVITDNRNDKVVYKELFSNAINYAISTIDDQIIYKAISENSDDFEDVDKAYIIIDCITDKVQVNYDTLK